jgi:hypothetical protein
LAGMLNRRLASRVTIMVGYSHIRQPQSTQGCAKRGRILIGPPLDGWNPSP